MKEEISLCVSIWKKEWRERFLTEGIKAGEIEGIADIIEEGKMKTIPGILCQTEVYMSGVPPEEWEDGEDLDFVVLGFCKKLNEVKIDWGDGNEAEENGLINKDAKTYEGCNIEELMELGCLFGSYVDEIKPEEIVGFDGVEETRKMW